MVRQPIQQEIIHIGTTECTLCPIDGQQPYPTVHAKGNGVTMNDVPKIQKEDSTVDNHNNICGDGISDPTVTVGYILIFPDIQINS